VYLIFALINTLTLPPVAGTKDSKYLLSVGESNGHDPTSNFTKAVQSLLTVTVRKIFCDDALRVSKGILSDRERHPVLALVDEILLNIPLEALLGHAGDYTKGAKIEPYFCMALEWLWR
jgi:hypothetical protein